MACLNRRWADMHPPMINRLDSLLSTVEGIEQGRIRTQDGSGRETTQENLDLYRKEIAKMISSVKEEQLAGLYDEILNRIE